MEPNAMAVTAMLCARQHGKSGLKTEKIKKKYKNALYGEKVRLTLYAGNV